MCPLDSESLKLGKPLLDSKQPKKSQSLTTGGADGVPLAPPILVREGPVDPLPEVVEVRRVLEGGGHPLTLPPVCNEVRLEVRPDVEDVETKAGPVELEVVSVTGQTVVVSTIVSVVSMMERAGQ